MRCRVWVNTTSGLSTTRQNPDPNRSTRRAFFFGKQGRQGRFSVYPYYYHPFLNPVTPPQLSVFSITLNGHLCQFAEKNSRLVAFYKAVNNLYPVLVGQLRPCSHQTRSYDPLTFTFLTPRTDYYKYLLLPRTIVDWN